MPRLDDWRERSALGRGSHWEKDIDKRQSEGVGRRDIGRGEKRRCEAEEVGSSSLELLPGHSRFCRDDRPLGEKDERERGIPLSPHTIGHTVANQNLF